MKNSVRIDTVKVFDDDDRNMKKLIALKGIKNKSEIYRMTLKESVTNHEMHVELAEMKKRIAELETELDQNTSLLQDVYTVLRRIETKLQ